MICYHGTTAQGLAAILNDSGKLDSPWTVSDNDGCMYVYPANKVAYQHDLEEEDKEEIENRGIEDCLGNAQFQAAITGKETTIYCLVLDIPDNILEDDHSCDNMQTVASYIYTDNFDVSMIKAVYAHKQNIWHYPFLIAELLRRAHFNPSAVEDENLITIAESLVELHWPDSISDFDLIEVNLLTLDTLKKVA